MLAAVKNVEVMKRFAVLLSFSFFLSAVARARLKDGSCNVYFGTLGEGTLGESEIGMILTVHGKAIEGAYFDRKFLKDILLKGSFGDERDITLDICHAITNGIFCHQTNGSFYLHFAEHDPHYGGTEVLQGEVLKGIWITQTNSEHRVGANPCFLPGWLRSCHVLTIANLGGALKPQMNARRSTRCFAVVHSPAILSFKSHLSPRS